MGSRLLNESTPTFTNFVRSSKLPRSNGAKSGKSMNITDLVKNKTAHFVHYRDGHFIYETEDGFQFPVPLADVGTATLFAEDKAVFFMRWIRRHLEVMALAKK